MEVAGGDQPCAEHGHGHEGRGDDPVRGRSPRDARWVDIWEEFDGEVDEGDIEEGDDAIDGADAGAARGRSDDGSQDEVEEIESEEDKAEGEAGAPGPPEVPGAVRPDHAGGEHDGAEEDTDAGAGEGEVVPEGSSLPEVAEAGKKDEEAGEEGVHCDGEVEVEHFLGRSGEFIDRRAIEGEVEGEGRGDEGQGPVGGEGAITRCDSHGGFENHTDDVQTGRHGACRGGALLSERAVAREGVRV